MRAVFWLVLSSFSWWCTAPAKRYPLRSSCLVSRLASFVWEFVRRLLWSDVRRAWLKYVLIGLDAWVIVRLAAYGLLQGTTVATQSALPRLHFPRLPPSCRLCWSSLHSAGRFDSTRTPRARVRRSRCSDLRFGPRHRDAGPRGCCDWSGDRIYRCDRCASGTFASHRGATGE